MSILNFRLSTLLHSPPAFRPSSVLIIIVALAIWIVAFQMRSRVIELHCFSAPDTCRYENINSFDRRFFIAESESAHEWSFVTQNAAGVVAFTVPVLLHGLAAGVAGVPVMAALAAVGTDWVVIAQAVTLNGAVNEISKLITQRPRPHVYKHPKVAGDNPHHYTSFYSGHTSFVMASMLALFLVLLGRGAGRIQWLVPVAGIGMFLLILTGTFRVYAGRHFLTDVIAAVLAGSFFALLSVIRNKKAIY